MFSRHQDQTSPLFQKVKIIPHLTDIWGDTPKFDVLVMSTHTHVCKTLNFVCSPLVCLCSGQLGKNRPNVVLSCKLDVESSDTNLKLTPLSRLRLK